MIDLYRPAALAKNLIVGLQFQSPTRVAVGDAVGLSVTITFLSLVFWAWVIGALGALLAIPLTLLVKALLFDIDPTTRWADVLIGAPMDQKPASPEKSGKPVAAEVAVDKE